MRKIGIACLLLSGCMSSHVLRLGEGQEIVQTLSITKQKQRIALLQKKLEMAERHFKEAQEDMERLQSELHQSQLALIAGQIESYERQIRQSGSSRLISQKAQEEKDAPFLKEREVLQQMMENGPSPEAFEAQVVLDRILRMITELRGLDEAR